jgi:hypothetical protein
VLEFAHVVVGTAELKFRSVVVDVSLGGLQLRSREEFAPGTICMLIIGQMNSEPMTVGAEVRYCRDLDKGLFATGFQVIVASDEEQKKWAGFVHAAFESGADAAD